MWPYLWKICELSIPHVYVFPVFSPTCFEPFRACFLINTQLTTRCLLCRHIYVACARSSHTAGSNNVRILVKIIKLCIPHVYVFPAFPPICFGLIWNHLVLFFLRCLSCRYIYLACAPVTSSASNNVRILVKNLQNIESLRLCLSSLFPHLFWTHMERFCPPHTLTLSWLPCPLHSHGCTQTHAYHTRPHTHFFRIQ